MVNISDVSEFLDTFMSDLAPEVKSVIVNDTIEEGV
jgi:hypothetical protein